jgi:GTP:adenosylcobinamide-phosphate guanylyltransferase
MINQTKSKNINHIVVQAGGLGSRMGNLTSAKPKALIPINGKPIIFHLMDCYPDSQFHVICDHMSDVLVKYIQKFRPNSKIEYIKTNEKGTCSGIHEAIKSIPEDEPFAITWSDLVFSEQQDIPEFGEVDLLIGLTNPSCSFDCRWKVEGSELVESQCTENGICGLFYVRNRSSLSDIPTEGSFTDYLRDASKRWGTFNIKSLLDIGTHAAFERYQKNNRYFNEVLIKETTVEKRAVVKEYEKLILDEIDWYSLMTSKGFERIPKVLSSNPYTLSRIAGVNPFMKDPNEEFFDDTISTIKAIHTLEKQPSDLEELREVYVNKTLQRVNLVKDIIPFAADSNITINGNAMENPFNSERIEGFIREIERVLISADEPFALIHGDCTFSNIIAANNECFLIDPRGYFGKRKYYGDPRYDWAKLYYSFFGNYDNINSKHYFVKVMDDHVFFDIDRNGWERYADRFFNSIPYAKREIDLLHILIWFSLCGYVIEDYSSIIISFYKGVELWNQYLKEYCK